MTPQESAIITVANIITDTVRETGATGAPGGILYAGLMGVLTYNQFAELMSALVKVGRLRKSGHVYFAV